MGRSYGGYLVMASLVWHLDLFRTGVAVCGISDFATFFAGTEPWIAQSAAHKYGHPEHDRELLRELSPMSRVDALRAPILAVHGEHDTNVPRASPSSSSGPPGNAGWRPNCCCCATRATTSAAPTTAVCSAGPLPTGWSGTWPAEVSEVPVTLQWRAGERCG